MFLIELFFTHIQKHLLTLNKHLRKVHRETNILKALSKKCNWYERKEEKLRKHLSCYSITSANYLLIQCRIQKLSLLLLSLITAVLFCTC